MNMKPEQEMRMDIFTLEEGDANLTWPAELSKESYDDLKEWLSLIDRKMKRAVKAREIKPGDILKVGGSI